MTDLVDAYALLSPRFAEHRYFCGFYPPAGWIPLVVELDSRLQANPDYRIVQVKEKFGGLCFYTDGLTESEKQIVQAAEEQSYHICQQCGGCDGVELRNYGWYATLCAVCSGTAANRGY
jgi:hypothetical protein